LPRLLLGKAMILPGWFQFGTPISVCNSKAQEFPCVASNVCGAACKPRSRMGAFIALCAVS
jgi:hypothetical protein